MKTDFYEKTAPWGKSCVNCKKYYPHYTQDEDGQFIRTYAGHCNGGKKGRMRNTNEGKCCENFEAKYSEAEIQAAKEKVEEYRRTKNRAEELREEVRREYGYSIWRY